LILTLLDTTYGPKKFSNPGEIAPVISTPLDKVSIL